MKQQPIDALMVVHVELGGNIFTLDAGADSRIDGDLEGLNQKLADLPNLISRWIFLETKAREVVEDLEAAVEILDAKLYTSLPAVIESEGKKATVEAIKSRIILDPERRGFQEKLMKARHDHSLLVGGRQVMYVTKDSLLALASNLRAEMDNQLYVAKRRAEGGFLGGKKETASGWD